jgi:tetratricopeptide (TPR) repeat protein
MRLSPRDGRAWLWLLFAGGAKLTLGADEEAAVRLRRSIEINRTFPLAHFFLAAALANLGKLDEAQAETRVGLTLNPTFTIQRFLAAQESDNPTFLTGKKRIIEGMRKAGVPEG